KIAFLELLERQILVANDGQPYLVEIVLADVQAVIGRPVILSPPDRDRRAFPDILRRYDVRSCARHQLEVVILEIAGAIERLEDLRRKNPHRARDEEVVPPQLLRLEPDDVFALGDRL